MDAAGCDAAPGDSQPAHQDHASKPANKKHIRMFIVISVARAHAVLPPQILYNRRDWYGSYDVITPVLFLLLAWSQPGSPESAPAAAPPTEPATPDAISTTAAAKTLPRRATLMRLNGDILRGTLATLAPAVTLISDDESDGEITLEWADVLNITPSTDRPPFVRSTPASAPSTSAPARTGPWRLHFVDGSQISAQLEDFSRTNLTAVGDDQRRLRFELAALEALAIASPPPAARERIAALLAGDDGDATPDEAAPAPERATNPPQAAQDIVILAKGTEVVELRGTISALEAQRVRLHWNGREVGIPWDRLLAARFAGRTPRGASCVVRLHGGDQLAGRIVNDEGARLDLQSSVFDRLPLEWTDVERIEVRSEKLVYLSDLRPKRYEIEPFFDRAWELGADRSLFGGTLRIGGQPFAKGVALHSAAQVAYALGGRFDELATLIGISDETPAGDAAVSIWGDGRELWSEKSVRGGQPPIPVQIAVRGVRELRLVVTHGANLDFGDQVIFGAARLIRP